MGALRASLPAGSNCANRGFAETMEPGHFAQTGPVLVHLVRAGPVPVHFVPPGPLLGDYAPAAPLLGDFARAGSLPAHFARAGRVGAFSWAGPLVEHLAQPVLGQLAQPVDLVRAVQARPVPAHLPRPPKPGIARTRLQPMADGFRSDSDWQVQKRQQFRRASQSVANPECRRLIELLASTDRCQAEAPICRPAKP